MLCGFCAAAWLLRCWKRFASVGLKEACGLVLEGGVWREEEGRRTRSCGGSRGRRGARTTGGGWTGREASKSRGIEPFAAMKPGGEGCHKRYVQNVDFRVRIHENDVLRAAAVNIVHNGRGVEYLVLDSVRPSTGDVAIRTDDIHVLPKGAYNNLHKRKLDSILHHCSRF